MRLMKTAFAAAAFLAFSAGLASAQTNAPAAPRPAARPEAVSPAPPAFPASVARTWARYQGAQEVQLRDVAALVRVRPEARDDVAVSIVNPGPLADPEFRIVRNRLIIDGNLRRQVRDCDVQGARFEVEIARRGTLRETQLPIIEIRVPRDVVLAASGAVRMQVAPSESAEIAISGCGDADIDRVDGEAEISISGAPDVRIYDAGSATIAVAGAGDVTLGVARSGLTVSIAGAGDFTAARADGPTNIAIQGAGDVLIRDGRATTLSVAIAGAGDVTHNGTAQRLDAAILGAGDVRVRHVDGEVTRRIIGGGEVVVGR